MVRRNRGRMATRLRREPILYTVEDAALSTADDVQSTTLYTSATSATVLTKPVRFTLGPTRVGFTYGSTATLVLAIVRKVPQGYTAPTITPASGNTVFNDVPNILGYGYIRVTGNDVMSRIDLRYLTKSVSLMRGDAIVLQVVSNAASAGQKYHALVEYDIA